VLDTILYELIPRYRISFVKPEAEKIGFFAISLPFWVGFVLLFREWNAGHEPEQEVNESWSKERGPSPFDIAGYEEDTPPDDSLTKIVWMARISP
jgi:hypothetical protein